jgi:hypothetical protein
MYFSAAASSENDHGSMNLASNTASLLCTRPSKVAPIQRSTGCRIFRLDIDDYLSAIGFIPAAIEVLGGEPELNEEVARKVLRLDFAPLFSPELEKCGLVSAQDDPRVRAANEIPAILPDVCPHVRSHDFLTHLKSRLIRPGPIHTQSYDPKHTVRSE